MDAEYELKILLIDLEVSFAEYYAYPQKYAQFLPARNIKRRQFVPCASWKWHNEVSVQLASVLDDKSKFKKNYRDDSGVAKTLHKLMEKADVVVAHNGDNFDIKHINTLFIKHGLQPVPKKKSIDTLKIARQNFRFEGNGLNDLLAFFGYPAKSRTPNWIKVAEGCEREIERTGKYCKVDVKRLEKIYVKLRPFLKRHPNVRKYKAISNCDCCRSRRLINKGREFDGYNFFYRIQCKECGHNNRASVKYVQT